MALKKLAKKGGLCDFKQELNDYKIDSVLIPGGCTKYIQAPDICWNKPFKGLVTKKYDEWIANGVHEHTKAENMKAAPRRFEGEYYLDFSLFLPKYLYRHLYPKKKNSTYSVILCIMLTLF